MQVRTRSGLLCLIVFILCFPGIFTRLNAESRKVKHVYTLPNTGLAELLAQPPLNLEDIDDHNIDLGGIGSDLWHSKENDGTGIYWTITDRGPNGEDPRTFPVPEFTPFILKVKTSDNTIEILQTIPITGSDIATDKGVTGLANLDNVIEPPALNEPFYDCLGLAGNQLTPNPHGLDTEGIVRTSDGTFWIVEEYGPSILKVDAQGRVLKRFFSE